MRRRRSQGRRSTRAFEPTERLTPAQVRAVAQQRLTDADCLHRTGLRRHTNGTIYLSGLVVDCLLKARLLEKHPELRVAHPSGLTGDALRLWQLIYRSHELHEMLAHLPELVERLSTIEHGGSAWLVSSLTRICSEWSVRTRYNPRLADIGDASEFFASVKELKPWLE